MSLDLLGAYDDQLRGATEVHDASDVVRLGPLWLARFPGDRGFITYRELPDDGPSIARLVAEATAHFRDGTDVGAVEWKTRDHDVAPGLEAALAENGYVADDPESIMIGEATALVADVPVPDDISIHPAITSDDLWAANEMQGRVFDDPLWRTRAEEAVRRFEAGEQQGFWIAVDAEGAVVCAGRLEPVDGTDFAGIWGGATLPEWRGRGIYRAMTARRAQVALDLGKRFINSDSTPYSRPILERSGFVAVSTTTPWSWTRDQA